MKLSQQMKAYDWPVPSNITFQIILHMCGDFSVLVRLKCKNAEDFNIDKMISKRRPQSFDVPRYSLR